MSVNRSEVAWKELRRLILSARLMPGERINISDTCKQLDVSLGAVREALSKLESERLVISEAKKGYRVAPVSREDLIDLTGSRVEIEQACLRRAISKGDAEWEGRIVGAFHSLSRIPLACPINPKNINADWVAQHSKFHDALVNACDLKWLLQIRTNLYEISERYRALSVPIDSGSRNIDSEHQKIMELVIDRDKKAACRAMADHLNTTTQIILSSNMGFLRSEMDVA